MTIQENKFYVFYDGECGFCNFWVHWILKRDTSDRFLFASLQSEFGQKFLSERGRKLHDLDTLYLWKPGKYYLQKSHAVFKIAEVLGGKYKLISYLRYLPTFITDFMYDRVAANRKKIGTGACEIPTLEERKKFIA